MHIIIGLALATFVLWLWLAGHWFGRVLAFLLFGVVAAVVAIAAGDGKGVIVAVSGIFGLIAAWLLSGAPRYYYQERIRQMMAD
jgi:hypothetical protein